MSGRSPNQRDPASGLDSLLCLFWGIVCVPQDACTPLFPSPHPQHHLVEASEGGQEGSQMVPSRAGGSSGSWGAGGCARSRRVSFSPSERKKNENHACLCLWVLQKTPLCLCDTHVKVCEARTFLVTHTHGGISSRSADFRGTKRETGRGDVMEKMSGGRVSQWGREDNTGSRE